jgi:hypothetical protein
MRPQACDKPVYSSLFLFISLCQVDSGSLACASFLGGQSVPRPDAAALPFVEPELSELALEELTTPLPACTVTDDPSGNVLDPESPSWRVEAALDVVQFAPTQLLAASLLLPDPVSDLACAPERPLAASAHGSFTC